MSVTFPDNFSIDTWYRGSRKIKVEQCHDKFTLMSNGDKFTRQGNEISLNGKVLTNMPDINPEDLVRIYKYNLKKKGYKILENKKINSSIEEILKVDEDEENGLYDYIYYDKNNDEQIGLCFCASHEEGCYWMMEKYLTKDKYNELFPNDRFFAIQDLLVRQNYRGLGYAKKLINLAINKAKKLNHTQIFLNAESMESFKGLSQIDLVNFYKSLGFKEILNQDKNNLMILNL